jgi:hypothetical protein
MARPPPSFADASELIEIVRAHAAPLPPAFRSAFLERVDELRSETEIGVGTVARVCAVAQKMFVDGDEPRPRGTRPR